MTKESRRNHEGITNSEARMTDYFAAVDLQRRLTVFDMRHADFFRREAFVIQELR